MIFLEVNNYEADGWADGELFHTLNHQLPPVPPMLLEGPVLGQILQPAPSPPPRGAASCLLPGEAGHNHCCFLHSHIPLNHTKSTRTSSEVTPSLLQSCFLAENSPLCQSFVIKCVKSAGSSKDSLHLSRSVVYSRSPLQTATSGCVVLEPGFLL